MWFNLLPEYMIPLLRFFPGLLTDQDVKAHGLWLLYRKCPSGEDFLDTVRILDYVSIWFMFFFSFLGSWFACLLFEIGLYEAYIHLRLTMSKMTLST